MTADKCEICHEPRRCGCYCGRHHALICVQGKSPREAKLQTMAEDEASNGRDLGTAAFLGRLTAAFWSRPGSLAALSEPRYAPNLGHPVLLQQAAGRYLEHVRR